MLFLSNSLLALAALAAAPLAQAAKSTTSTETITVFLPQRATGTAGSNIYATVLTSNASTTEYLLACQTAFSAPYTCDGDFKNVTLTYAPSAIMDVAIGASTYNCTLGSSAVCATRTASAADDVTTTLNATASAAWMTPITVLDDGKKRSTKKSSSTTKTATASSSLCKRRTGSGSGSSGSDSGSFNSGSNNSGSTTDSDGTTSSSDTDADGTTSSSTKKTSDTSDSDSDSCSSGAAQLAWDMGFFGFVGTGLAFVVAL